MLYIFWNTGDDYWDNFPELDEFDNWEDLEKVLERHYTEEERRAVENGELNIYDEDETTYCVTNDLY